MQCFTWAAFATASVGAFYLLVCTGVHGFAAFGIDADAIVRAARN